jgi:hypothetical protein
MKNFGNFFRVKYNALKALIYLKYAPAMKAIFTKYDAIFVLQCYLH